MERSAEDRRKFSIKVESQELDRIIQARKNLDDVKSLAVYAARYMELGWSPVALEAYTGADLQVDFSQPQATCLWGLMDKALQDTRIGLAIRLDAKNPLLVLKVRPALVQSLDRLGNWRSSCVALLGDVWEQHFLVLPPTWSFPTEQIIGAGEAPLAVMGPGQLVAVPPSFDPAVQETWHWLSPPWVQPPGEPSAELLILLEGCGILVKKKSLALAADLPSWKEIYPLISHSDKLLHALLAPEESSERYYQKVLQEAVQAGFRNPRFLQGLLWHAPHGDLRQDPEGWLKLTSWVERLQGLLAAETSSLILSAPGVIEDVPSSPQDLMAELQALTDQTLEFEQHLERLEDLRLTSEPEAEGRADLQESLGELAELRQAVEDFLAGMKGLEDSESD